MRVRKAQPRFDGRMARQAEVLGFLPEEALPSAIVGRVTGEAFASTRKTVKVLLPPRGAKGLVADHAQGPPAGSMKDGDVRRSVGLVAPLALPIPQGLMGRG